MAYIKIGIIGPGLIFWKRHYPVIDKKKSSYRISAVLSKSSSKNQLFSDNVMHTNDEGEFFEKGDFKAVFICSPIYLHGHHIKLSLDKGKWVFVEKPVVGSLYEVTEMEKLDPREKNRVFVAENYRYLPTLLKLKKLIETYNYPPLFAELQNFKYWLDKSNLYAKTEWRRNPKHEGGLFLDFGIHIISVLRWFFKDVEILSKSIFSVTKQFGKYDTLLATLKSNKGTIIHLKLSYGLVDNDPTIIKVFYQDSSYKCSKTNLEIQTINGKTVESFENDTDIDKEIDTFYKFVRGNEYPKYSLEDALLDIRTCFKYIIE